MSQRGAFILRSVNHKQLSLTHPTAVSTSTQDTGFYNSWDLSEGTYGWITGGFSNITNVDRIDFSNDSITASARTGLNLGLDSHGAAGNSNYAWLGGGRNPSTNSAVVRIDFSNDLALSSTRGPLSAARYTISATSNVDYGWFIGGSNGPYLSRIDRIDFSNDNVVASIRG
jgi:hypothetical protein